MQYTGYEIRHGRSAPASDLSEAIEGGLGYVDGPVLAVYVHGMFEAPEVLEALFGPDSANRLDDTFDALADAIEANTDFPAIERLAGV